MPKPKPALTAEQPRPSELFTVRLWREQLNDHYEWRGKVQHVTSGETRYFRDWQGLVARMQEMLNASESKDVNL